MKLSETVNQRTDNTMTKGRKKQIDKEESTKHYTELLVSRKSEYKQIIMPTFWEETHHWILTMSIVWCWLALVYE